MPRDVAANHDANLLTAEDFSAVTGSTVYDAVRQLRPEWIMRSRPNPVLPNQNLIIYVDGNRYGSGIDGLRLITIRAAYSVRYFSPSSAEGRFGPGHLLGAIEVITNPH
ncbi:MAG: hypothetical protein DMD58_05490 [Gemmatimonadetes bacterium]|nr:MAG: hypothetical protein DMD58_05490 [Gemmatimonadota bacterium]